MPNIGQQQHVAIRNLPVSELRQQLLYTFPAVARKAVKDEANGFIVRGVHRSEAKILDGLRSEGYCPVTDLAFEPFPKTFAKHPSPMNIERFRARKVD